MHRAQQPWIRVKRDTEGGARKATAKYGDFSCLDHGPLPVFSGRSREVLRPHIETLGEWLRLECDEAEYWLFNVTNTIDALDESSSKIARFRDGGVMAIDRFMSRSDVLRHQMIFTIPQRPLGHIFVTEPFVQLVDRHKLTGFDFKLLWSNEEVEVGLHPRR